MLIILFKYRSHIMIEKLKNSGIYSIWPIGRGIPWGNHGCLPVVTSWHKLQIRLYIWSVGVSLEHQRNYAWALALLSSHRMWARDRCKRSLHQWPRKWGIRCRWVGAKTVPKWGWSLGVDHATSLSAGVPPLHPPRWRLQKNSPGKGRG